MYSNNAFVTNIRNIYIPKLLHLYLNLRLDYKVVKIKTFYIESNESISSYDKKKMDHWKKAKFFS